jgi:predicted AAA+ superfamily ATPase
MGARQVGKREHPTGDIATHEHAASAVSLDNQAAREAATSDPDGFIAGLGRPALLDEVQRGGPDLLSAIKDVVDGDESLGQFLLTGPANLLTNRRVNDALTGRIEIITLWPLSQSEIEGSSSNFVDTLFSAKPPRIEKAKLHAAARDGLPGEDVQAWRPSIGSRESTTPKGLHRRQRPVDSPSGSQRKAAGRGWSTRRQGPGELVTMEVMRHLEWADTNATLYHYRRKDDEIDVVLEDRAGDLACIEIKAAATIREKDRRQLARIRDARNRQFRTGFVIYTDDQTIPLGDRLWVVPVSGLWA